MKNTLLALAVAVLAGVALTGCAPAEPEIVPRPAPPTQPGGPIPAGAPGSPSSAPSTRPQGPPPPPGVPLPR